MGRRIHILLATALAVASADPALAAPAERLDPISSPVQVELDDVAWFAVGSDYLVVPEGTDATVFTQAMSTARRCFSERFGVEAPSGAVMTTASVGLFELLPEDRRGWVLPWKFEPTGSGSTQAHVQTPSEAASSLRHELGHLFLMNSLLPNRLKPQYGGDAPDWLDEAAGVALESPASRSDRRRRFTSLVSDGRLARFTAFVAQTHPVFASRRLQDEVARARATSPDQPVVLEFTLAELGLNGNSADDFYAQTGGVIDFLDSLGLPNALGLIARDIRDTNEPLGWLGHLGSELGLVTPNDWDRRFDIWARDTGGAPSPHDCGSGEA